MSYWLHRVNIWESFPCLDNDVGPTMRCRVSIPGASLMNFSQTQYDVFYLAREPPRTTGYIFQRASGSGRFVDIDVDDSLMDDLAAKQVYFDAMHTIDQYLSSISQHCVSSFRSNGMNADEIQYFGFPLYLMYTYNKQYMSVTVVPPSSHYF